MLLPGALLDTLLSAGYAGPAAGCAEPAVGVLRLLLVVLSLLLVVLRLLLVALSLLLVVLRLLLVALSLLLVVLRLLLLLLGLLLVALSVFLLLLGLLGCVGPALLLLILLLGMLRLGVLRLRLLSMLLLRAQPSMPTLLLFGMVLLVALLFVLSVNRNSDSENQGQNGCAGDSNSFHVCYLRCCSLRLLYCKLPVCGLTGLPMASPDTRSSTLRFCCRPAELSFEATARLLPKPLAVTAFDDTPCCTR